MTDIRKWFRRRKEIAVNPWIYLPPVEIPGVGQVHGEIIEDDATKAEWALENCGAAYAYAYEYYKLRLQRMISQRTWRSEAAFDILARIVKSLGDGLFNLSERERCPDDVQREAYAGRRSHAG